MRKSGGERKEGGTSSKRKRGGKDGARAGGIHNNDLVLYNI